MKRFDSIPPGNAIIPVEPSKPNHRRDLSSMLTSTLFHALLLVLMACWVMPSMPNAMRILHVSAVEYESPMLESINLSNDFVPLVPVDVETSVEVAVASTVAPIRLSLDELKPNPGSQVGRDVAPASFMPAEFSVKSLSTSTSVEGAVDRITEELREKLEQGGLLVVWLLDSSHSLVDDRQRVAARLTPFYEGLVDDRGSRKHELVSAVVSYGREMRERVAPTQFGNKIVRAVEDLPVDRSGLENVFEAVMQCARHYRESWPDEQFAIVIWTDESGDDHRYLEGAIETCRAQRVSVSVVGPSSVLGADTGLHSYTDPKTDSVYQLPVRRGPDSAMPERIELGYWYVTRMGRGRGLEGGRGGGRRGRGPLPSWLGGQDLEGILSGFSPYALTRLSMQTAGSYTIFDREEDRGPFDPTAMMAYAPSYGTYADYKASIQSSSLRVAVMKAVDELAGKQIDAPPTMLFIKSTGPRVFDFVRFYYPPTEFQAKVRSSRGRLLAQAARYSKLVEAALRHVSAADDPDVGLEDLYQYEESPRWRAWYDLTRGRLLATSVRLEEYRLTVNAMSKPGALAGTTNHVILVASPEKRSGESFRSRAEEAERLLRRCVEENRGTPWEMLAQRELDFALGVGVREMSLTQEPMGPAIRQPNLPRF